MSAPGAVDDAGDTLPDARPDVEALIPIVRRIIRARVNDPSMADDLIQETLVRVLAKVDRYVEWGLGLRVLRPSDRNW